MSDVFDNLSVEKQVKIGNVVLNIPTSYKGSVIMGAFPISTKQAEQLIGHRLLKPAEFKFGKSVVCLTVFNNFFTPVGPYKEIVLSIPVLHNPSISLPGIPFMFNRIFKNFGFFVFMIASDTDISREESAVFGYPHYDRNIEILFTYEKGSFQALAFEGKEKILSLRINKRMKEKKEKKNYKTYFKNDGKLFTVLINTDALVGRSRDKDTCLLELGEHNIVNILKDLQINTNSLEVSYYLDAVEVLNLPKEIEEA